jgi:hypothetical protein
LPDVAPSNIVVSEVEGQVSVKAPQASDYVLIKQGAEIAEGSSLRTGSDGKATVSWFGDAESRIGPDSEIAVVAAQIDPDTGASLRVRLESGRMWSRVMRLLDLNTDMTVETNDVVATVRGTSFDMEKKPAQPTTLWVADSVVEASGASVAGPQDGFFVPEGSMATFGGLTPTNSVQPLTDQDRNTDWFKNNRQADADFRANKVKRLFDSLAVDRVPTTGVLHDITESAETLREKLASGSQRQVLAGRILLRRLAVVRRTIEEGKSGLGYQEFARLDGDLRDQISSNPEAAKSLRPAVLMAQVLYRDVLPSDPAYRVKQQLEEWLPLVARNSSDVLFARLLSIDARLDEASTEADALSFDQTGQMIILARQGLTNADREIGEAKGVDAPMHTRLRHIWKALSVRADALDARLKAALSPPPALPTILIDTTSTSTSANATTTTTSTPPVPVAPTQLPKIVSLQIQPAQSVLAFGNSVTFSAIVVYDTGLTRDVTKLTKFQSNLQGYGALNGNVFTASQLQGTITFTGTFDESGQVFTGNSVMIIR